jgi:hypothetical protein
MAARAVAKGGPRCCYGDCVKPAQWKIFSNCACAQLRPIDLSCRVHVERLAAALAGSDPHRAGVILKPTETGRFQ